MNNYQLWLAFLTASYYPFPSQAGSGESGLGREEIRNFSDRIRICRERWKNELWKLSVPLVWALTKASSWFVYLKGLGSSLLEHIKSLPRQNSQQGLCSALLKNKHLVFRLKNHFPECWVGCVYCREGFITETLLVAIPLVLSSCKKTNVVGWHVSVVCLDFYPNWETDHTLSEQKTTMK